MSDLTTQENIESTEADVTSDAPGLTSQNPSRSQDDAQAPVPFPELRLGPPSSTTPALTLDRAHGISLAILGTLFALVLVLWGHFFGIDRYPLDDAYIVQHSVTGIFSGTESRFLDATVFDGVTSPVFVLLLALLSTVLPLHVAHWAIQAVCALGFVLGIYVLALQKRLPAPICLIIAITSAIAGMTPYQLFNGLETGMAMAAITWILIALESSQPPKFTYVLAGLLPFIRPELTALSGLCLIHFLRMPAFRRPKDMKLGFALAFGAFLLLAITLFILSGELIPNTVSAKKYFFADGHLPLSIKFQMVGLVCLSFLSVYGMPSLGFLFLNKGSRCGPVLWLFMAAFFTANFINHPGGIARNGQRYLYVFAPLALFGVICVIRSFLEEPKATKAQRAKQLIFTWGLGLILLGHSAAKLPERLNFLDQELTRLTDQNRITTQWMEEHLPQGVPVLIHDAGIVSTLGTHPLVDMVGLKTRFSTQIHRQITYPSCGENMGQALKAIIDHFHTQYVVLEDLFDAESLLSTSLKQEGFELKLLSGELGDNPYRVFQLIPPEGPSTQTPPSQAEMSQVQ